MSEQRFVYGETDLFEWVEDNGQMISTKECVNKLNEQQATITELKKEIKRLKCMNNQLERRLDYSIAYDMGECE